MATVNPTITYLNDRRAVKVTWALTSADADGAPLGATLLDFPNRTVYFLGTWGGATAVLEGGDGSTYVSLTDPQGNAISKNADGIEGPVAEAPEFVRPRLSVAGAGAEVTVTVIARK